jgi:twitching motility protein PilT
MRTALMAADTGHTVLSTLHTTDVVQTVQRIISFYPPHQHEEVRLGIASNLRAVICQRLIPRADGRGRAPAAEIMVSTPTIQEYIMNPDKIPLLNSLVAEGATQYGMQTFDQSVLGLIRDGLITEEEGLRNSSHPNELILKLKGILAASDRVWQPVDNTRESLAAPIGSGDGASPLEESSGHSGEFGGSGRRSKRP